MPELFHASMHHAQRYALRYIFTMVQLWLLLGSTQWHGYAASNHGLRYVIKSLPYNLGIASLLGLVALGVGRWGRCLRIITPVLCWLLSVAYLIQIEGDTHVKYMHRLPWWAFVASTLCAALIGFSKRATSTPTPKYPRVALLGYVPLLFTLIYMGLGDQQHIVHRLYTKTPLGTFMAWASVQEVPQNATKNPRPSTTLGASFFSSHIWLHRVNSLERLRIAMHTFEGFEIDVSITSQPPLRFDVGHPPTASIGLTLAEMLAEAGVSQHYFWLDIKNLNPNNVHKVVQHLRELDEKFALRHRIIVESPEVTLLAPVQRAGFMVSYYVPSMVGYPPVMRKNIVLGIKENLFKSKVHAISQGMGHYTQLNRNFPLCAKLLWDLSADWNQTAFRLRIHELLAQDDTIKVVLVRHHTEGYR